MFRFIRIKLNERAVVFQNGLPAKALGAGRHLLVGRNYTEQRFDTEELVFNALPQVRAILPKDWFAEVKIGAKERGVLFRDGRPREFLRPGTHRLTLSVEYAVEDAALATTRVASVRDALYLAVQLAARDFVAGVTLDELLEGRDAMTKYLESKVVPQAVRFGVRVEAVGIKDVVLPGEMKTLLNRVIEAEKEAAANVILRREETAATRSLANTARVMVEHPVLLRLKELEAMKEIAERIEEVRVVVGADGFGALLPAGLLARGEKVGSG